MRPKAASAVAGTPRRFTVEELDRLGQAGIFGEDEHVELLEGVIVELTPPGKPHALALSRLDRILQRQLPDTTTVRVQMPLTLGRHDAPEPDLALVETAEEAAAPKHPRSALLVVEVSDSSLRSDHQRKARVYARAGIPEYWIVDVAEHEIEVLTSPSPRGADYRQRRTARPGELLKIARLPDVVVPVEQVFDRKPAK